MKTFAMVITATILTYSCSTPKAVTEGSSTQEKTVTEKEIIGSSFESAIVIKEKTEMEGIKAEYQWLSENFPGYTSKGQALVYNENRPYDIITIKTIDETIRKVYFDISKFFGKF